MRGIRANVVRHLDPCYMTHESYKVVEILFKIFLIQNFWPHLKIQDTCNFQIIAKDFTK